MIFAENKQKTSYNSSETLSFKDNTIIKNWASLNCSVFIRMDFITLKLLWSPHMVQMFLEAAQQKSKLRIHKCREWEALKGNEDSRVSSGSGYLCQLIAATEFFNS